MASILLFLLVIVVVGFLLLRKAFTSIGDGIRRRNPGSERLETDGAMMTEDRAYDIFGLPPSADPLKVKQVYRDLVEAWHPDTSGITGDKRIKDLNSAYDYLKQAGRAR